jgi:hypothetical protein
LSSYPSISLREQWPKNGSHFHSWEAQVKDNETGGPDILYRPKGLRYPRHDTVGKRSGDIGHHCLWPPTPPDWRKCSPCFHLSFLYRSEWYTTPWHKV